MVVLEGRRENALMWQALGENVQCAGSGVSADKDLRGKWLELTIYI